MDEPSDLAQLRSIVEAAPDPVDEEIGLLFHRSLSPPSYDQTPRNVLTFASTGGDGVQFSLLVHDGAVGNDSAVVMTVPGARHPNRIVGRSLRHFLGLGRHSSYFVLEQFQYDFGETVQRLEKRDYWQALSRDARRLLDRLERDIKITAWSDISRELAALDAEFTQQLDQKN